MCIIIPELEACVPVKKYLYRIFRFTGILNFHEYNQYVMVYKKKNKNPIKIYISLAV